MSNFNDDSKSFTDISADIQSLSSSTKEFDGVRGFENEQSISASTETASETTIQKTTTSIKSGPTSSQIVESNVKEEELKQPSEQNESSSTSMSKQPEKVIQIANTLGLPDASQLIFDYSQSFPSLSTSLVSVNTIDIEDEYKKIEDVKGAIGCNQYYKQLNPQYIEKMSKLQLYKPDIAEQQQVFAFDGDTLDEQKYGLLEQFHDQILKYQNITFRTLQQDSILKILQECYYMLLDDSLNCDKIEDHLDTMISYVK